MNIAFQNAAIKVAHVEVFILGSHLRERHLNLQCIHDLLQLFIEDTHQGVAQALLL